MSMQIRKVAKKDFDNLDINKCINRLIYGQSIYKITKKGKKLPQKIHFFILENDTSKLQWMHGSNMTRCRIDLKTVTYISELPTVVNAKAIEKYDNSLLLSIHYGRDEELLLLFDNKETKFEWWCGLQYFVDEAQDEEANL